MNEPDHFIWAKPITHEFPNTGASQFYPGELTPDPQIHRVLPNHYLDLDHWETIRHYPKFPLNAIAPQEIPEAIAQIVDCLSTQIAAIVDAFPCVYIPLTAGRDSRMLLACSKAVSEKVHYVTFDYVPDKTQYQRLLGTLQGNDYRQSVENDIRTAQKLAEMLTLRHTVIPVRTSHSKEKKRILQQNYLRRIGYSGGAAKAREHDWSCRQHCDLSGAWLTGCAGEVGRCCYWGRFFPEEGTECKRRPTPRQLRHSRTIPRLPEFEAAVQRWLETLPDASTREILDLVYLEHRVGGWASPHTYGFAPLALTAHPFCHRKIFDIMLRLPAEYRQRQTLTDDIVRHAWAEAGRLPYNQPVGLHAGLSAFRSMAPSAADALGNWLDSRRGGPARKKGQGQKGQGKGDP